MVPSSDAEIRAALHTKKFKRYHNSDEFLVIDELGVGHGKKRVDIAVVNGHIHGYEIKSAKDSLTRLPSQVEEYSKCLERISIVCAPNHVANAMALVPSWCGVIVANKGTRGAINFSTRRRSQRNPNVELQELARLLWKSEAAALLRECGASMPCIKEPRAKYYEKIAGEVSLRELTAFIKDRFANREGWRVDSRPLLDGDLRPLASK